MRFLFDYSMELKGRNAKMEEEAESLKCEGIQTEALLHQLLPAFVVAQFLDGKTVNACKFLHHFVISLTLNTSSKKYEARFEVKSLSIFFSEK